MSEENSDPISENKPNPRYEVEDIVSAIAREAAALDKTSFQPPEDAVNMQESLLADFGSNFETISAMEAAALDKALFELPEDATNVRKSVLVDFQSNFEALGADAALNPGIEAGAAAAEIIQRALRIDETMRNLVTVAGEIVGFNQVDIPALVQTTRLPSTADFPPQHVLNIPADEYFILPSGPRTPEPAPAGGTLCITVNVQRPNFEEIANLLNGEFKLQESPALFLRQHDDLEDYWLIEQFNGPEEKAWELIETAEGSEQTSGFNALEEWRQSLQEIGYVHVSVRPLTPIRYYAYSEHHKATVTGLAVRVRNELVKWGFAVQEPEITDELLPQAEEIWSGFSSFTVIDTVDNLLGRVRSFLLSVGLVSASTTIRRTLRPDEVVRIEYPLNEDCLIVLEVDVRAPIEAFTQTKVYCFNKVALTRNKIMQKGHEHVEALVNALKETGRWRPEKPTQTKDLDPWFDYYHACKAAGVKYTFGDMANDVHRSENYLNQQHGLYKAEHGIS